jgi:hypothetical protein
LARLRFPSFCLHYILSNYNKESIKKQYNYPT